MASGALEEGEHQVERLVVEVPEEEVRIESNRIVTNRIVTNHEPLRYALRYANSHLSQSELPLY